MLNSARMVNDRVRDLVITIVKWATTTGHVIGPTCHYDVTISTPLTTICPPTSGIQVLWLSTVRIAHISRTKKITVSEQRSRVNHGKDQQVLS